MRRICGRLTGEPELHRKRLPFSSVTPSVSPLAKQSLNAWNCQSSWTAVYLLTPPSPPHPTPSPCRPPLQLQTPSTWTPTGPWSICASSLPQLQSSHLHWRRGLKSFPKTHLHTSGLRSALAHLSRLQPEPCHPNRCLCWHPSLTSSPDLQQLKHGTARWDWLRTEWSDSTLMSRIEG